MTLAIVDTTVTEADAQSATSASHTIAAGNAAALIANSNAQTSVAATLPVTGAHPFVERVLRNLTDSGGTNGASAGDTINNSAGTTGTTTVTITGTTSNGVSFTIWELSGCETAFTGAVAEGTNTAGLTDLSITPTYNGSFIFGGAEDFAQRGTFTVGALETLDNVFDAAGITTAEWHSTATVLGGVAFGSTALGFANRNYNTVALEMVPATGTCALTGTVTASINEADIVTGGKTAIATLTNSAFVAAAASQPIIYVGGQGAGFAGTTSAQTITFALTGGIATTPAAGDLVVITYFIGSTVQRFGAIRNTSATNYTTMGSVLWQSDTFDANQITAYRFMPGTPETQFVLTETVGGGTGNVADAGRYTVHVFRGVDTSTPMDVAVVTAGGIDSSQVNPGSITPTTAGAFIYIGGGAASTTGSTMTATYLSDFRAGSTADTNDASIGAGWRPWTGGAYDGANWGSIPGDTTANSWTCITAALRPAALTPFDTARAAALAGLDSAQAEATGWDAVVKNNQAVGSLVRTSATVVTDTLAAFGTYNITAQETVTWTIPASILEGAAIVAAPAFTIAQTGGAPVVGGPLAGSLHLVGGILVGGRLAA